MKLEVFTDPDTRLKPQDVICHWDFESPGLLLDWYDKTGEGETVNVDAFKRKEVGGLIVGPQPHLTLGKCHEMLEMKHGSLVIWRDRNRSTSIKKKALFNLPLPLP